MCPLRKFLVTFLAFVHAIGNTANIANREFGDGMLLAEVYDLPRGFVENVSLLTCELR